MTPWEERLRLHAEHCAKCKPLLEVVEANKWSMTTKGRELMWEIKTHMESPTFGS